MRRRLLSVLASDPRWVPASELGTLDPDEVGGLIQQGLIEYSRPLDAFRATPEGRVRDFEKAARRT